MKGRTPSVYRGLLALAAEDDEGAPIITLWLVGAVICEPASVRLWLEREDLVQIFTGRQSGAGTERGDASHAYFPMRVQAG